MREGALQSDGVIHLAFIHDFGDYAGANRTDRAAIEAIGAALKNSGRPLVIASGVGTVAKGRPATEDDPSAPDIDRSAAATMTLTLAEKGVRSSVVRLPPTVHGRGDNGFIAMLVETAHRKGFSGYIGDGSNVWPAVHRSDAARVFRLALEKSPAGSMWHAVAEEGVPARTIAEAVGRQFDLPVASVERAAATEHFGWLGGIWAADLPTSSASTRQRLGWQPTGPTLLDDLEKGRYFKARSAAS